MKDRKIYSYIENNKLNIEEIMKDYTNYIYTIIRNFNLNLSQEDSEEVVLDVFMVLWKNKEKLDINRSMSAYIGGITKNLIKYKFRQIKDTNNIEDFELKLTDSINIESILIQKQKQKIILDELEKIKKEDKDVFIEYYYDNCSIKEISKKLNMSESKVKSKLFRVRKKLSKVLKERGYSSDE